MVDNVAKDLLDNKHRLESPALKLEINNEGMFIIYISKQMADDILKKERVETIIQNISSTQKPFHLAVKTNFAINIKNKAQKVSSENVLGYVEGTDLKEELIVITAHYDHLGIDGKIVYNGADDDGSGTVAVRSKTNGTLHRRGSRSAPERLQYSTQRQTSLPGRLPRPRVSRTNRGHCQSMAPQPKWRVEPERRG